MREQHEQFGLWDTIFEQKQITKPIRLIELFAGIGAQFKALKSIGAMVESYKICEWAIPSFMAYNAIHIKDTNDYSKDKSADEIIDKINGVSINYNEPLSKERLRSKNINELKNIYNNVIATHNLINIMSVHGKDLEIVDKNKYEYIMTYSFPCQDLSLMGKRQGMSISQANGGTRSGLLWEVERILGELKKEELPQVLIMENVPEVISPKNTKDFQKWQQRLTELGYNNYCELLNATDYGIPQNRNRAYMVSILGDYSYHFPLKLELQYKAKDFLEKNVDEKYFLTKKFISGMMSKSGENGEYPRKEQFLQSINSITNKGICRTITTNVGHRDADNYYLESGTSKEMFCEKIIQKGCIKKFDIIDHSFTNKQMNKEKLSIKSEDGVCPTLLTRADCSGICVEKNYENYIEWKEKGKFDSDCRAWKENKQVGTITTSKPPMVLKKDLRIRKLTPNECIRLMGFEYNDYESMKNIGLSNQKIYHCAGDSIVVPVLMGIFSKLIYNDNSYLDIIEKYIKKIVNS